MQTPECPVPAAIVFVSYYKVFLVYLEDCYCLTPIIIRGCSYCLLTPLTLTLFLRFFPSFLSSYGKDLMEISHIELYVPRSLSLPNV